MTTFFTHAKTLVCPLLLVGTTDEDGLAKTRSRSRMSSTNLTNSSAECARRSTYGSRPWAPKASRAVGAANGKNPISILVPCHRVVGESGTLTGYAGGMAKKRLLLELERSVA
jgi:O-6-methylguanine DNA methyltransferase